jgi:hypothetical protein
VAERPAASQEGLSSMELVVIVVVVVVILLLLEPGERSRYSHWLRVGRPRGRSWNPGEGKNFHFSMSSRPALGPTQPPIQWVPWALSLEVKRPGREAGRSLPTSAEAKKTWIYTSTPPYALLAVVLN